MKIKAYPLLLTIGTALAALAILITLLILLPQNKSTDAKNSGIPKYTYLLKDYEGKVAVFQPDNTTPEKILDIYLNTLPEYDQNRLREGIPVHDQSELERYIEDFDS